VFVPWVRDAVTAWVVPPVAPSVVVLLVMVTPLLAGTTVTVRGLPAVAAGFVCTKTLPTL
jgi:hypothetical protein